jgi:succinoglycan biosynthesis transport protein ExoP
MDLGTYLKPLRRMWWLILAAVLVATVASFLMVRRVPPTYQSRVLLMIGHTLRNPNPNSAELYMSQQLATTYLDILQREQLRKAVQVAVGLDWLPRYSARIVPETQLIELTVEDGIPLRAQAIANEAANQLIRLTPADTENVDQSRQAFIAQQLDELEASIKATREEISKRQSELASMLSARQITDAQTQIAALENKLRTLQANYAALMQGTQQGATNAITIIEPATLPTEPIGSNKAAMVLTAAAIGFALAAAGAYLLDYLDDTLKNPEDIQKSLGLATLGAVPRTRPGAGQNGLLLGSPQAVVEAYNVLRTNLQFAAVGDRLGSLLITSPSPHEGKSLTAANLGIALAQASQEVILVDVDLRRPHQHKFFGLSNSVGVTSALLQPNPSLDSLLQQTAVPGLRVLTSGPVPPNPAQLLSAPRMRELLAGLYAEADIVILDSPPATFVADAAILSAYVDGVLLVVDAGSTRRGPAQRAMEALKQVNARVIGVTFNRMPRGGYYHYYRYESSSDGSRVRRNGRPRRGLVGASTPQARQDQKSASSDS